MKLNFNLEKILNNKYLAAFLSLVIASYAGFSGPKLSPKMTNFLQSDLFRIIAVFLIAYMSSKNFQIALILSIGLITTLNFVDQHKMFETFE